MLPLSLAESFYSGRRIPGLKFKEKEAIKVLSGIHTGKVGAVVGLDLTQTEPFYLVDFGDGTDELLAESVLDHMLRAV